MHSILDIMCKCALTTILGHGNLEGQEEKMGLRTDLKNPKQTDELTESATTSSKESDSTIGEGNLSTITELFNNKRKSIFFL